MTRKCQMSVHNHRMLCLLRTHKRIFHSLFILHYCLTEEKTQKSLNLQKESRKVQVKFYDYSCFLLVTPVSPGKRKSIGTGILGFFQRLPLSTVKSRFHSDRVVEQETGLKCFLQFDERRSISVSPGDRVTKPLRTRSQQWFRYTPTGVFDAD